MADIIFIYADEDAPRVRDLCAELDKAGVACDPDRSVPTGQTYAVYMTERLAAAKAVVMCWSAAALTQTRLTDEAAAARDAGKLAPVTLDGTLPPLGFGQLQTANLKNWPDQGAKNALDTLAAALRRMRDGVDNPASLRSRWAAPHSPFVRTWKFWILSALTAAAIGALFFLSPEGRAEMGEGLAGRLGALAVFVVLAFMFTPASRALLHLSRRLIGLDSRAFFSGEYLALLIVSLAAAGAISVFNLNGGADAAAQRYSLLYTLGAGATVLPLALSLILLPLRGLRRLVFGPVRAA